MERPVFKPEFYRELALENPLGLTIHWREAEAWFNYIAWPAYKTYGYTKHHRATRRWWARVTMRDLDRARDAMENVKFEEAQVDQDKLDLEPQLYPPALNDSPVLRKILGGKGGRAK